MDQEISSCEASLLFGAPGASDPALLARDIRKIAQTYHLEHRRTETISGLLVHLDFGLAHVIVALCADPLPVGHFLAARRPRASMTDEQVVLRQLTRQTAHLSVLVMNTPGAAGPPAEDRRLLCWDITEHLSALTAPDFVFWADTDTLYTADEFDRQCDFVGAQWAVPEIATPPDQSHPHLRGEPVLAPEAEAWLAPDPGFAPQQPSHDPAADAEIAQLARRNTGLGLTPPGRWSVQRAIRSIAMICAGATVGLTGTAGFGGFF